MPPRPGEGDARGELVFVSYSHEDAPWVQRLAVLLKPLLRNRRLRLWVDNTSLRGGAAWRPEIEAAIARSTAALVLVSGDYLASDFIMDEELPALVRHGVRLLPVLVGDCFWKEEPALAERQWLHDPGHDGPLGRDAGDAYRRDERLVAVCRKLVAALPAEPAAEPGSAPGPADNTVAEVPAGPSAGALSGVPDDPPGYVVRDELAALIAAVAATDTGGAVGITPENLPFGLLGQGGIGKSVLAAALGRDDRVRHRFPDGVLWVPVGEHADVLAVQLDLLARLGSGGPAPRTISDATTQLGDVLRERRVLLLVDDVWSDAAAHAFRVTGPQGRVVYTTRERGVVAAVGAREYAIGVLSAEAARAVAATVLGLDVGALPDAADRAFTEVGRVALAVSLLAAAVRGGRSWDGVADELRRETDVYGDHPYANTFKAMQIAVATLPVDLAVALLGLAVFPPDTAVPVQAVARYWAHTRGPDVDTSGDLDRLASANVLRRDGDAIEFHDLQHDHLLLHCPELPVLHAELLHAYRALLPDGGRDGWWQLPPDEPYVWEHLVAHLAGAGERRALATTVTDPAYLARRIGGGGMHAAGADLTRAAEALPEHPSIAWWRRWLARHAPFLAGSGRALAESVAPTMRAWLRADPTQPAPVEPDRLVRVLSSPYPEVRWGLSPPAPALVRGLTGHHGDVDTVDWSPDGTLVAGGSVDGEVRLWNPDTGETVAVAGAGGRVRKVVWSPDGRRLAVVAGSGAWVCDAQGRPTGSPLDAHGAVRDLAWSPDGRRLALLDDGHLRLCDRSGAPLEWPVDPGGDVVHVAWSGDGHSLAVVDVVGVVEILDAATGRRTGAPRHFAEVDALSWNPRSDTLAVTGSGRVHLWRPADDAVVGIFGGPVNLEYTESVEAGAWSPTGARLATGGRTVRVWDLADRRSVATLGSHTDLVRSLAWAPDGVRLATAGGDREVQIWDTTPGHDVAPDRSAGWVHAVAVSHDGGRVATLDGSRRPFARSVVHIRDVASGRTTATVPVTGHGRTLAWSTDGHLLHVAGTESRRWESATGGPTVVQREVSWNRRDLWSALAWASGGRRLAAAHSGRIKVWNDGEPGVAITVPYSGEITALAWSGDGVRLAACGKGPAGATDGWEIIVWEVGDDRIRLTHRHDGCRNAVLAWSPDGSRLVVAARSGPSMLWNPATADTTPLGHGGPVTGVAWSPDGRHVVTITEDGDVAVRDVDGTSCTRLQLAGANCVAWEGSTLVVGQRTGPAVLELRTLGDPAPER